MKKLFFFPIRKTIVLTYRSINSSLRFRAVTRDLEKDRAAIDKEEKRLQIEIKQAAKAGRQNQAKQLALQLIRLRKQRDKNYAISGQITGIAHRTTVRRHIFIEN